MERTFSAKEARDGNATMAICVTCPECQGSGKCKLIVRLEGRKIIGEQQVCPLCHGATKILGTMTIAEFARLLAEEFPGVLRAATGSRW